METLSKVDKYDILVTGQNESVWQLYWGLKDMTKIHWVVSQLLNVVWIQTMYHSEDGTCYTEWVNKKLYTYKNACNLTTY